MGCCSSSPVSWLSTAGGTSRLKHPRWKSEKALTAQQLQAKREEFWDTAPAYGGDKVIWDALRAASEADTTTALLILDSAGISWTGSTLHTCYDERGRKYELPDYVLAPPDNLHKGSDTQTDMSDVELMTRENSAPVT